MGGFRSLDMLSKGMEEHVSSLSCCSLPYCELIALPWLPMMICHYGPKATDGSNWSWTEISKIVSPKYGFLLYKLNISAIFYSVET